MKIRELSSQHYQNTLTTGMIREGYLIHITDEKGNKGTGDLAPLPKWSKETLKESISQLQQYQNAILDMTWTAHNCFENLKALPFLPSVEFALESAILAIVDPLPAFAIPRSALLMGTPTDILKQAELRLKDDCKSAKLKVGNLTYQDAFFIIEQLKDKFLLRIDVNRAWPASESLEFFSQFPKDAFNYVEEPFQNPKELNRFTHPLAIDESFPSDLSLDELEQLPCLKALIYKPTIQGGLTSCLKLDEWCKQKNIPLVLSSSYESRIGLKHIENMAYRLSLCHTPIGLGTIHYFNSS